MLSVETDGPVLTATLNRPEVRNALDDALLERLLDLFTSLPTDVRVVVLAGAGETFCAGGDLNWMRRAASYTEAQNEADALLVAHVFQSIVDCSAVVIAMVRGAAFGGGAGLAAAADVAIATSGTKFSFSEVKLGLVPATISRVVLPKIGTGHARHLFTTGEVFDADHALRIGLVHDVVPTEGFEMAVYRRIKNVLASGPQAVTAAKRLAIQPILDEAGAAQLLARIRGGDEAKEGISAFLEKRKAAFVVEP